MTLNECQERIYEIFRHEIKHDTGRDVVPEGTANIFNPEKNVFVFPYLMVGILQKIAKEFRFSLTDDFIDALEDCTLQKLAELVYLKVV